MARCNPEGHFLWERGRSRSDTPLRTTQTQDAASFGRLEGFVNMYES